MFDRSSLSVLALMIGVVSVANARMDDERVRELRNHHRRENPEDHHNHQQFDERERDSFHVHSGYLRTLQLHARRSDMGSVRSW